MLQERRQAPRARTYLPVRIQPANNASVVETLTRDIGYHGMRCLTSTPIAAHTPVRIDLTLPLRRTVVSIQAQTQWLRELPHSDQFEVGIVFLADPPEEYRQVLTTYFSAAV